MDAKPREYFDIWIVQAYREEMKLKINRLVFTLKPGVYNAIGYFYTKAE